MDAYRKWSCALAALASVGLCLTSAPAATMDAPKPLAARPIAPLLIRDVELAEGGVLVGRLLDADGRPMTNAAVSLLVGDDLVAQTRSDADGIFAVASLRGGVHQIVTAEASQLCRLWAHGTAPPRAAQSIDVVTSSDVVRGQWGGPPHHPFLRKAKHWATNPFVIGGVAAAAVAVPIALSDDDGPHS